MFQKVNIPILGLVENMSSFVCESCDKEHFIFGKEGVAQSAVELGIKHLGSIPLELELRVGSDEGKPYMTRSEFEGRRAFTAYSEMANSMADLSGVKPDAKKSSGFLGKFFTR